MAAWNVVQGTKFSTSQRLAAQHQCGPHCNVRVASPAPEAAWHGAGGSRRTSLPPQVVREFGNVFCCTTSGVQHVCDRNCTQLIQLDQYSLICKVSRKVVPLDTADTMALQHGGGRRWGPAREHRRAAVAWPAVAARRRRADLAQLAVQTPSAVAPRKRPAGRRPEGGPIASRRKRNGDQEALSPRRCGARKHKTDQWSVPQSGDAMVM
jgi:hypothetical protein